MDLEELEEIDLEARPFGHYPCIISRVRPRLCAETTIEPRTPLRRASTGRWTVTTDKELLVLSGELELLCSFDLPYPTSGAHAVAHDLTVAVLSLTDRVLTIDRRGWVLWEHPHDPWTGGDSGSCWVQDDGAVWATMPGPQDCDRWVVLGGTDGRLLADLRLDGHGAGSDAVPHPDGRWTGLSVGTGSGGFRLYWGRSDDHGTRLRRVPGQGGALADVHPHGGCYLTTAADHEALALHDLDDGKVLASVPAGELFDDDLIDFGAAFLTDDIILARAVVGGQHLALDAHRLDRLDTIRYPFGEQHDTVFSAGPGRWVTADWLDGYIRLWEL